MSDPWANFAVTVGGASGALTGLLFVGVSINRDAIVKHARLRASAAQTLVQFTVPLTLAVVLLVPDQPRPALGTELLAVAVVTALIQAQLGRRRRLEPVDRTNRITYLLAHRSATLVSPLLTATAGALLVSRVSGALYWIVPAVLLALVQGIVTAWVFLIADPRS